MALSVWQAFVVPTGLACWALLQFFSRRGEDRDKRRSDNQAAETEADARERLRLDAGQAGLLARLEAEIARKDAEIADLRRSDAEGWRAAAAARDGWNDCKHSATATIQRLAALLDGAKVRYLPPEVLTTPPPLDALARRRV